MPQLESGGHGMTESAAERRLARLNGLDEGQVRGMAAKIAGMAGERCVIHLSGPIGAGKTAFAAEFLAALGVSGARPSPSYPLLELYMASGRRLGHMDFFRLRDPHEWLAAGLAEQAGELDVCLVEWPSNAAGLPHPDLRIEIGPGNAAHLRNVSVEGVSPWGAECCARLSSH